MTFLSHTSGIDCLSPDFHEKIAESLKSAPDLVEDVEQVPSPPVVAYVEQKELDLESRELKKRISEDTRLDGLERLFLERKRLEKS
jgi:hypothetical protein